MTQEAPAPLYCPRCGGLMYKPAGSLYYWHTTSYHPPCNITNIANIPVTKVHSETSPGQQKQAGKPDA